MEQTALLTVAILASIVATAALTAWWTGRQPQRQPVNLSTEALRTPIVRAMEADKGEPVQVAMGAMIVLADLLNEALANGKVFGAFTSLDDAGDTEFIVKIAELKPGEQAHYRVEKT